MVVTPWTEQKTQTVALHIIAAHGVSPAGPNLYRVESQSTPGHAYLVAYRGVWACECAFHQSAGKGCCHIAAARLYKRTGDPDLGVAPVTYAQAWSAYNAAQTAEVRLFDALLADLVGTLPAEDGPRQRGNQPLPMREQVFAAVLKVYSQLSSRRAASLFGNATERGQLDHAPHFNAPSKFLNKPEATPILRALIQQSAVPLAGIEQDFAVDSTGFCTGTRGDYRMGRYGGVTPREWLKAHLCVGVATHIVADAIVTGSDGEGSGDSPNFGPLVRSVAERFNVREVSADKAYSSKENLWTVADLGAEALIPFKGGKSTPEGVSAGHGVPGLHGSAKLWKKAYHYFAMNQEEFYERYHKRSNVESVNSAIKRKFGEVLKSKNRIAQTNELLCKILAYNLTVLIHEMHEAGIAPAFCTSNAPAAPQILLQTH
jgi:hypothetical protein